MDRDDDSYRRFIRAVFRDWRAQDDDDPEWQPLALPERIDSDTVRVSLADDATWAHVRRLYPSPETLEGGR